ncbi:hypothetical protein [Symbiopectobacterium sp. RP]|uniref:hypothetical protein n=1 Tax=Symbiopectobacterium sp. RP TaxID=3248553 RepID=UPI003D284AB4
MKITVRNTTSANEKKLDIANRLKNDYGQCPDMWQKIQLIVIKIMSLGYTWLSMRVISPRNCLGSISDIAASGDSVSPNSCNGAI